MVGEERQGLGERETERERENGREEGRRETEEGGDRGWESSYNPEGIIPVLTRFCALDKLLSWIFGSSSKRSLFGHVTVRLGASSSQTHLSCPSPRVVALWIFEELCKNQSILLVMRTLPLRQSQDATRRAEEARLVTPT